MRKVPFDPANLTAAQRTWWDKWSVRAKQETEDLVAARRNGTAAVPKQQVWADLKAWLLTNVFNGKCAYCEAPISGSFFGEGEHYRPKGKVTILDSGRKVAVKIGNAAHPGYFWLVYDWKNLVPSCQECNNRKSDLFPIAGTHVGAPSPTFEDLDRDEKPLLLHPYRDDPRQYLMFGMNGVVAAKDDNAIGSNTIRVFGLDRAELAERRKRRQEQTLAYLLKVIVDVIERRTTLETALELYVGADAEYSTAARDVVMAELPRIVQQIAQIRI